jgi:hypothetical protein
MCVRTDVHENHTNTERNRKKQLRTYVRVRIARSGYVHRNVYAGVGLVVCPTLAVAVELQLCGRVLFVQIIMQF